MADVKLVSVYKVYDGGVKAVNDFNLDISDNEFVVFVGPSGCGKSTTLRMIAGLEEITAGSLYIDGKLVNDLEPKDRDIAMVFQNYALYPHMTVYDNMAFGLKQIKMDNQEIDKRVNEAAEILGITHLLSRKPKALSGGQRQRVALGRAIVREPKVFLLDEPLSNLDAKLRVQMRSEIIKIHERVKTTFIYVTHDQTEAMTMGSKIVVMKDGYIQQIDSPKNLYDEPGNIFVATFLGLPQMNLFDVVLSEENGSLYATLENDTNVKIDLGKVINNQLINREYIGKTVVLGIRPEDLYLTDKESYNFAPVDIHYYEMLGSETVLYTTMNGRTEDIIISTRDKNAIDREDSIYLSININRVHLFDKETTKRIIGLPEENIFDSRISFNEEGYSISLSNQDIKFDDAMNINPDYRTDRNVLVGVSPLKVSIEPIEESVALTGKVDFVVESGKSKIVYINKIIKDKPFVIRLPLNTNLELEEGSELTIYIKKDDFTIREKDTKNIVKTKYPFFENKTIGNVIVKKGKVKIVVAGQTIVYDKECFESNIQSGRYEISISNKAFRIPSTRLEKKNAFAINPINEEVLGDNKVVYAKDNSFEHGYISAIVNKEVSIFVKGKLKLFVDPNEIKFKKVD